jgi:hypothetical protein
MKKGTTKKKTTPKERYILLTAKFYGFTVVCTPEALLGKIAAFDQHNFGPISEVIKINSSVSYTVAESWRLTLVETKTKRQDTV